MSNLSTTTTTFTRLSDDVVLQIFFLLEDDPRNWARLSCVCKKFCSLISTVCYKSKCISAVPSLVSSEFSGRWASLFKLSVCCPGLLLSGVLLDNSDFGLARDLGPDEAFIEPTRPDPTRVIESYDTGGEANNYNITSHDFGGDDVVGDGSSSSTTWSLYDDLYFDMMYNSSETDLGSTPIDTVTGVVQGRTQEFHVGSEHVAATSNNASDSIFVATDEKRRKVDPTTSPRKRSVRSHLASGGWNLSREQGNKLLAGRFREDCLYICDWPGCTHMEEKRNYMLFRGFFRNFKRSQVWRTINDGNRSKIDLNCAFCICKETWDLHSAFCLRRGFGFHDDGEPVVRAYVCENGHVSGAWTDLPLYT